MGCAKHDSNVRFISYGEVAIGRGRHWGKRLPSGDRFYTKKSRSGDRSYRGGSGGGRDHRSYRGGVRGKRLRDQEIVSTRRSRDQEIAPTGEVSGRGRDQEIAPTAGGGGRDQEIAPTAVRRGESGDRSLEEEVAIRRSLLQGKMSLKKNKAVEFPPPLCRLVHIDLSLKHLCYSRDDFNSPQVVVALPAAPMCPLRRCARVRVWRFPSNETSSIW